MLEKTPFVENGSGDTTAESPCRVAVLISGTGSNLRAMIESDYPLDIALVISNKPDVGGLDIAEQADIPNKVIKHNEYPTRAAFEADLSLALEAADVDLVVLAGFMRILSPAFVTRFNGKVVNIHPSLLPKYPGLDTHQRAIDAGDSLAGASVHFVTDELDGGPLVAQVAVPVKGDDSAESLAARVLRMEHKLYPLVVHWITSGRIQITASAGSDEDSALSYRVLLDNKALPETGYDATKLLETSH